MSAANNGTGPCGACKFLRRKCVKGCVFAPYFDSDQGTAHFAAVHKVFGASNAAKLLQGTPVHRRVDAVFTLCYEALARVRDPVYGCAGHIFTLQQQVVNLQAELAYIQARLSTLQCLSLVLPQSQAECRSPTTFHSASELGSDLVCSSDTSMNVFDLPQPQQTSIELAGSPNPFNRVTEDEDLQALAWEFVSQCHPGVRFRPSTSG
ncbi:hypothetical protein ERO13_D12G105000v2 [Gossypium hirsutum]|uniref:LOB domain-containing protein 19 n=7 Tax=Gossypium TaxID=3633 RepID=A0ABM3B6A1_GOSHI|nr:LOB domain-containing protein 19-like [Gossypium hirsutum]KAB1998814.1 hypothetical protein ES319_D12G116000v1 [Gossypium barbadense]MBA0633863.1 hypothetical protein [Gossypium davidsonii]MBA0655988.1 hypothetical protein [Gossypium klotzschianum]TYG40792.1 hypothetical protein ES288_D12G122600v1 [Gossypium darwinii]TYH38646.1 hypothetical protein ES332_D12G124100v1 [Gossypium tomentosum]TYI50658.1 hypothetical protein E1A91_D12G117500v1 [Gossypium mustelinum]